MAKKSEKALSEAGHFLSEGTRSERRAASLILVEAARAKVTTEQRRAYGRKGGLNRAKNLTAAQLSAIGRKGGRPRKKPPEESK